MLNFSKINTTKTKKEKEDENMKKQWRRFFVER